MIIFSSFVILLLLSPVLIENEEKMTSKKYTPQEIARLILLCWHGEADKQQMTELEEWLEESADNRSFYNDSKRAMKKLSNCYFIVITPHYAFLPIKY